MNTISILTTHIGIDTDLTIAVNKAGEAYNNFAKTLDGAIPISHCMTTNYVVRELGYWYIVLTVFLERRY